MPCRLKMYDDSDDVEEFNFKILVVGEVSVGKVRSCGSVWLSSSIVQILNSYSGNYSTMLSYFFHAKTSIIRRYTQGQFSTSYMPTLGADFALKVIHWDSKSRIHLQLWDVAGHERYGHMTRVYYKYAMAAFIVYDLSRPDTWNAVLKWYNDLTQNIMTEDEEPIPVVLLANKCDMNGVGYDKSYLTTFCEEHGLEGWFPVSAKTNKNIDDAMNHIISAILSKRPYKERIRPGTPWYRAQSPRPATPITVHPVEDEDIDTQRPGLQHTAVESKACC